MSGISLSPFELARGKRLLQARLAELRACGPCNVIQSLDVLAVVEFCTVEGPTEILVDPLGLRARLLAQHGAAP